LSSCETYQTFLKASVKLTELEPPSIRRYLQSDGSRDDEEREKVGWVSQELNPSYELVRLHAQPR